MKKIVLRKATEVPLGLRQSQLHPVLQRIYANRQLETVNEIDQDLSALLPFKNLLNIEFAAKHLAEALTQQKRILIVGDYDVDGATSTTLMVRVLREFGGKNIDFIVPNRFKHGYGLSPKLLDVLLQNKPDLIVTVDNGISSVEAVQLANQQGISVIITDHHLQGEVLPDAVAIVNPNQKGDSFLSKNLAGVGVAFYLLMALRVVLREQGWFNARKEPNLANYLDLVALGTVADVVKLDCNNRIIVAQGLRRIRAGKCSPGIIAMYKIAGRELSNAQARDMGFLVGPRLNAAGRLEDMSLGVRCLLTDDLMEAEALAQQLEELNIERRTIEQEMRTEAYSLLHHSYSKLEHAFGVCLIHDDWHPGVVGILASRIKDRLYRPTIIFAKSGDSEIKGSGRSVPEVHIREILASINTENPGLIIRFGGHAMAAGLTLKKQDFQKFSELFDQHIRIFMKNKDFQPKLFSDGELSNDDFGVELAKMIEAAGPWGEGFSEPLFDGEFDLLNQYIVGKKHLKLTLASNAKIIEAIAFNVNMDEWPNDRSTKVKLAYRLNVNNYRGCENVQLVVEYLEPING